METVKKLVVVLDVEAQAMNVISFVGINMADK